MSHIEFFNIIDAFLFAFEATKDFMPIIPIIFLVALLLSLFNRMNRLSFPRTYRHGTYLWTKKSRIAQHVWLESDYQRMAFEAGCWQSLERANREFLHYLSEGNALRPYHLKRVWYYQFAKEMGFVVKSSDE